MWKFCSTLPDVCGGRTSPPHFQTAAGADMVNYSFFLLFTSSFRIITFSLSCPDFNAYFWHARIPSRMINLQSVWHGYFSNSVLFSFSQLLIYRTDKHQTDITYFSWDDLPQIIQSWSRNNRKIFKCPTRDKPPNYVNRFLIHVESMSSLL